MHHPGSQAFDFSEAQGGDGPAKRGMADDLGRELMMTFK